MGDLGVGDAHVRSHRGLFDGPLGSAPETFFRKTPARSVVLGADHGLRLGCGDVLLARC